MDAYITLSTTITVPYGDDEEERVGAAVTRVLLEGMKVNTIRRDQGGIALHVDLGPLPLDQAPARCEKLAAFVKEAAAEGVPNHRASWASGMMLR